jgi:hypothetical protein
MNRLLPLTLALGALAAPAAASAAPIQTYDYAVTIQGSLDYNRADVDGEASAQHDLALDSKTTIPQLRFVNDSVEDSRGAQGTATVRRGSYTITGPSASLRCTGHTLNGVTGGGLDATHGAGKITFAARVIDAFDVQVHDCGSVMAPWTFAVGSDGAEVGVGIFDGAFTMPTSRIGEGSMTFPLKGAVTGSSCPFNHHNTVLCSLTWDATVTFKRIGEDTFVLPDPPAEDELVVPLVPQPPAKDDLVVPIVPEQPKADLLEPLARQASLARNLRSAALPLVCAQACKGTVTATAKGRTLAKRAFQAAAGRTATPRLRFDAADRRAIRRAKAVQLRVAATVGGRPVRKTVTLRAR